MKEIRIGEGAGYAGAWAEPAVASILRGNLDYLTIEVLAERSLALAQMRRMADPSAGYDLGLKDRMSTILGAALDHNVRIVSNMGAANPLSAGEAIIDLTRQLSPGRHVRVGVVSGDDVTELIRTRLGSESLEELRFNSDQLLSANAYVGAAPLVEALEMGADVVVAGRVADPSLALACLLHEFNWARDDWALLGSGILAGHLLECSAQVTGGYFGHPGLKQVRGLGQIGYPISAVRPEGDCTITKPEATGGVVNELTCKEQILYEVENPAQYFTPDVTADFSSVRCRALGEDEVLVTGASGTARPKMLKVLAALKGGFIGEGEISYGGPGSLLRAQSAIDILRERFDVLGFEPSDIRFDLIGFDSLFGQGNPDKRVQATNADPAEVRLRVAAKTGSRSGAETVPREMEALWIVGPAGGGGAAGRTREVVRTQACYLPREEVDSQVTVEMLET